MYLCVCVFGADRISQQTLDPGYSLDPMWTQSTASGVTWAFRMSAVLRKVSGV